MAARNRGEIVNEDALFRAKALRVAGVVILLGIQIAGVAFGISPDKSANVLALGIALLVWSLHLRLDAREAPPQ